VILVVSSGPPPGEGEGEGEPVPIAGTPGEMASVPAGTFEMANLGSVTLSAYSIGKYEVTNGEFADVMNWALAQPYIPPSYSGGNVILNGNVLLRIESVACQIEFVDGQFVPRIRDGRSMAKDPVVEVTWHGAVAFCNWLSLIQGLTPCYNLTTWQRLTPVRNGYRLPTEAEWECAAAWDASLSYHWNYAFMSNTIRATRANYRSSNPLHLTSAPYTSVIGFYSGLNASTVDSRSPVGAYDMSGNVWEWCHDRYGTYPQPPLVNPTGPTTGLGRITRGGSWGSTATGCRTDNRGYVVLPSFSGEGFGFRVARSM